MDLCSMSLCFLLYMYTLDNEMKLENVVERVSTKKRWCIYP
jgi:hypothetical protein